MPQAVSFSWLPDRPEVRGPADGLERAAAGPLAELSLVPERHVEERERPRRPGSRRRGAPCRARVRAPSAGCTTASRSRRTWTSSGVSRWRQPSPMAPASTLAYVGRASAPIAWIAASRGAVRGSPVTVNCAPARSIPAASRGAGTAGPRGSPACTCAACAGAARVRQPADDGRRILERRGLGAKGAEPRDGARPRTRRARSTGSAGGGRGGWPRPGRTSVRAGRRTPRVRSTGTSASEPGTFHVAWRQPRPPRAESTTSVFTARSRRN